MKNHTISPKENLRRALMRTGDCEWVPVGDITKLVIPRELGERPTFGQSGHDWFGCAWNFEANGTFAPDLKKPVLLDDVCDWRDTVKFPDVRSIDWEAAAARDMADIDPEQDWSVLFFESGPFERTHHLLGFESALCAMYEEPEEYAALVDAITDYKVELLDCILSAYRVDEVFAHDDLGTANDAFFSNEIYDRFFRKNHKRIGDVIKKHGSVYMHHSCGRMQNFIPALAECGAQAVTGTQSCNDRKWVADTYHDIMSFEVMPDTICRIEATEEDIRQEVRDIIDAFGPYKNFWVQPMPLFAEFEKNAAIACDEAHRYGEHYYE